MKTELMNLMQPDNILQQSMAPKDSLLIGIGLYLETQKANIPADLRQCLDAAKTRVADLAKLSGVKPSNTERESIAAHAEMPDRVDGVRLRALPYSEAAQPVAYAGFSVRMTPSPQSTPRPVRDVPRSGRPVVLGGKLHQVVPLLGQPSKRQEQPKGYTFPP